MSLGIIVLGTLEPLGGRSSLLAPFLCPSVAFAATLRPRLRLDPLREVAEEVALELCRCRMRELPQLQQAQAEQEMSHI